MNTLVNEKCVPVAPRCDDNTLLTLLAQIPDWQCDKNQAVQAAQTALVREFRFKNYYHVMSFVNAIAWIANKDAHHPDMEVSYNRVLVKFTTHDSNGVSRNDFICAAKVDALLSLGDFGPVLA